VEQRAIHFRKALIILKSITAEIYYVNQELILKEAKINNDELNVQIEVIKLEMQFVKNFDFEIILKA
jgi:hypothetical protein